MAKVLYPLHSDRRYTITQEFCGYSGPRFVLRFCGEWIDQSISQAAMITRAAGHNSIRLGAEPIVEVL